MSRPTPASMFHRMHVWSPAAACCAALLLFSSPVGAGLGDMVKKAKEKVTQTTSLEPAETAAAAEDQVVFDDVILELNGDRLDHILATFKAASAAATGRPELAHKLRVLSDESAKLWEKDGDAIRDLRRERGDIEICYHDGYQAARDKRGQEYAAKGMTDPAILAKFTRLAQENNAAAMKGDSAAIARASQGVMEVMLPTKEDSASVRKSCGPLPPKGASERRIDELDKQMAPINEAIRKIDEKVAEAQSKQGGLNQQPWGMALERIQMLLTHMKYDEKFKSNSKGKSNSGSGSLVSAGLTGFSRIELEALETRLESLRGYLGD